jgi:hypothetical protein
MLHEYPCHNKMIFMETTTTVQLNYVLDHTQYQTEQSGQFKLQYWFDRRPVESQATLAKTMLSMPEWNPSTSAILLSQLSHLMVLYCTTVKFSQSFNKKVRMCIHLSTKSFKEINIQQAWANYGNIPLAVQHTQNNFTIKWVCDLQYELTQTITGT